MATTTQKKRAIRYLNRDFESFKKDLVEHLRIYFPDTVQDFNESSVGMMFTELVSFMGDNLSFYLDKKFDESFLETARERENIFKHAKQLGFPAFGKSSATGVVDGYLKVPATASAGNIIPDTRYAGTIKKGAKLKGNSGKTYETLIDADFSTVDITNPNFVQVGDRDTTTQEPTTFILKKQNIEIKAGETKTTSFTVGAYESFRTLSIQEDDVLEVIEVTDSEGNQWYETEFLAQDTVFDGVANTGDDATEVPFVLKLRSVPYRFVTEFDAASNRMSLVFGTGDAQNFDGELIPDLGDLSLPLFGKDTFTDFSLDPQNFLKTRTLGLAPVNTTMTVKYRAGGGADTNAGSGEIATVADATFDIGDSTLNSTTIKDVGNSFAVLNPNPIQGGRDEFTLDEIRQLVSANFSTQARLVTAPDFVARALSMPNKFGSIFRANAKVSGLNKNAVELIVLSRDSNGYVSEAPQDLKVNLKRYLSRFRMLTDAIEILDGEIIHIGVEFEVLTNPDFNKSEVVVNCIESLREFFEIEKWQINQPINTTTLNALLASVPGVLSIISLGVVNRIGNYDSRSYSRTKHNIKENTQNGIIYGKENAIFEVKFPNKDITGAAR
jgi:hypothetical protein